MVPKAVIEKRCFATLSTVANCNICGKGPESARVRSWKVVPKVGAEVEVWMSSVARVEGSWATMLVWWGRMRREGREEKIGGLRSVRRLVKAEVGDNSSSSGVKGSLAAESMHDRFRRRSWAALMAVSC